MNQTSEPITLFVYGTLLQGLSRHECLESAVFKGYGRVQGTLYDLGSYPGLREGKDWVYGEIYEIPHDTLHLLDGIEGYEPDHPEYSLYLRTPIEVESLHDGRSRDALTYVYSHQIAETSKIPSGDYRQHLSFRLQSAPIYIAYGSNLNPERLFERIGSFEVLCKGTLPGFGLTINKGNGDGSGYANLQWLQDGGGAPFVAYQLDNYRQLERLDRYEGVPYSYVRLCIPFIDPTQDRWLFGSLYVATPEQLDPDCIPSPRYLAHLKQGYAYHGLGTPAVDLT